MGLIRTGDVGPQTYRGVPLAQIDGTTCGPTVLIIARGQLDPGYPTAGVDFAEWFKREQLRVHRETNRVWPRALGTTPAGMAAYLRRHTGVAYGWQFVGDLADAWRDTVRAVGQGHPVCLLVGGSGWGVQALPRHYVAALAVDDGDLIVFEPSEGATHRLSESAFREGRLGAAGGNWNHVKGIVLPR